MDKIQNEVKAVVKALGAIAKKMEKIAKQIDSHPPVKAPKKAAVKKVAAKKTAVKKPAARKKVVKKAAAKKTTAKKAVPKKAAVKKPAPKKAAPAKQTAVVDAVFKVIKGSKKGVTVGQIKTKTGLSSKQVSNVCYKLTQKGTIVAKSRGVYTKK